MAWHTSNWCRHEWEARSVPRRGMAALFAESVLPDERNEDHRLHLALREGGPVSLHDGQPLLLASADRHDQASAIRRQLLEQWPRDGRAGGRHDDRLVGSALRPAQRAIA